MPGIPAARVVAIIAETQSGRTQVGSGYLLDATRVLTAWHCTTDGKLGRTAARLRVVRAADGTAAAVSVAAAAPGLDVALLSVDGDPPWGTQVPGGPVTFGRVDQEHSGQLDGCEAAGFPRWQTRESDGFRDVAEVHGVIHALEGRESQRLVLRILGLGGVAADGGSAWAGFAGAAVFHRGLLLGVVIEQRPSQGDTVLQIRPVEAIAKAEDTAAQQLAEALGIGRVGTLTTAGQDAYAADGGLQRPETLREPVSAPGRVTADHVILNSGLSELRSAVVSPSGSLACTYGSSSQTNHSLTVWDLRTRTARQQITLNSPPVAVRFTLDESALVIAGRDDQKAQVWRHALENQEIPLVLLHEQTDIAGIAISRDSRTTVFRKRGGGLFVLDTETGPPRSLGLQESVYRAAVAPGGELVVASTVSGIQIYGPDDSLIGSSDTGHVTTMDCSARKVVAASGRSVSVVWQEGASERRDVYTAPEQIQRIAVGTAGSMVAVAYGGGLTIVDLDTGEILINWQTESPVKRLTFRLNDKTLVTAHEDNNARLWDLPDREPGNRDHLDWQSDAPAHEDLLQRQPLARALADRLRQFEQDERTSFLVHIDGPWGSGKSTLLQLLREELEGQSQKEIVRSSAGAEWLTINFNAWQQSKVGASWWTLLAALRRDVTRGRRLPARCWLRISETWARSRRGGAPFILAIIVLAALAATLFFLLRPSNLTFASAADIAKGASALIAALGTLWAGSKVAARIFLWDSAQGARLYEQSSVNPMLDVSRHFGWLVAKSGKPVAFFIDDLDRCADTYVVELLETVQTLVRDPPGSGTRTGTTSPSFVVAADGAWIRRAFETSYSQFGTAVAEPGVPLGYLFLDKLFQLRVRVPRLDGARRKQYLRCLLGTAEENAHADFKASVEQVRTRVSQSPGEADILQALSDATPEVRNAVAPDAIKKLSSPPVAAATEHWLQRFAPLLPPNPRAMKRFINDYSVLRAVRTLEGSAVGMGPLAIWSIIETRWPSLADYLCQHPEAIILARKSEAEDDLHPAIDDIPPDLLRIFFDPDLREIVASSSAGPLSAELIAQCCGAGTISSESLLSICLRASTARYALNRAL